MNFTLNSLIWGGGNITAVPSLIIDKHLRLCGSLALKVILLILRDSALYKNAETLAEKLKADVTDVGDAINYWVEAGVLTPENQAPQAILPTIQSDSPPTSPQKSESVELKIPPPTEERKMLLSREEVNSLIENDKTLYDLLNEAQTIFGKVFTSADTEVLVRLYTYYSLSPHYIIMLLNFCSEIDRRGMAYAKNVADTWINDGIDDHNVDAHVDKLLYLRSLEGRLKKSMGLNRSFISTEKKYIARWSDFGFDCNMITLAYEQNVTAIGKVNFKYIDKILSDWNQKNYKTPEDTKKKFEAKITLNGKKENPKPKEESEFMRLLMENYDKE